jgi:hypothetical protein
MAEKQSSTEYEVWYTLRDGSRRHRRATSKEGVKEIIADAHADEDRTQLLANQFGLQIVDHEHDFEIRKVTTKVEPVQL